jgi:stage II sporulation protein AB (anti-sigma F factor)
MTPLFTTDTSGERSGMGFAVMQTFMDKLDVYSKVNEGVRILMTKHLS